mmetsp:Transcript_5132/g.13070  ORF Transcript_5132/g.13070 Transcript_5132/m.13070 type:complete len:464 (-) Transcript_5132:228-1619(-)|eukprot:CAMPEP_0197617848 /NCGR_PEP_ID=MMETSP1326-20131121/61239_1 /TAXON_ID=1155430 /ORGANISM="Genus nov. species nov., Strain RCC2288" /LENGTH=463 /DNA_ID=CAMNT_0043186743 /DNA_START=231 /DNA_END=1622 /DNA_ORIENTATION=-
MAAVVKAAIEHNHERKETSDFQKDMHPLLKALSEGGLPEELQEKHKPGGKGHGGFHPHVPAASSSSSSANQDASSVTVGAAGAAWDVDGHPVKAEEEDEYVDDDEFKVMTRLYVDKDDETHELKTRIPRKDIPVHAEFTQALHNGHMEDEITMAGVKVPWYLWDRLESAQARCYVFYNGDLIQFFTAGLIFSNFIANAAEAQVRTGEASEAFSGLEMFYTAIFTIELAVNFYAHKWGHFVNSWNIFDSVVVSVSLLSLMLDNLPGISTLRLMRAFRVFRLFKRLASLRKIMEALANSVPGCSNAFAIVILVTSIYSILGVQFFKEVGEGDMKGRYFGTFLRAMLTMFQVMTGDSWAEGVSRPIMEWYPDNGQRVMVQLYFVTYILLVGIVLTNVVVAVLLEKMTMDDDVEEVPEEDQLKGNSDNQFKSLVGALAIRFHKQDQSMDDLKHQIAELKKVIAASAR